MLIFSKSKSPQVRYNSLAHPPQPNLKPLPQQSRCITSHQVTPFHHPPNIDSPTILVSVTWLPCSCALSYCWDHEPAHNFGPCVIWDRRQGPFWGWLTFSVGHQTFPKAAVHSCFCAASWSDHSIQSNRATSSSQPNIATQPGSPSNGAQGAPSPTHHLSFPSCLHQGDEIMLGSSR